jgi:hypothetical protein
VPRPSAPVLFDVSGDAFSGLGASNAYPNVRQLQLVINIFLDFIPISNASIVCVYYGCISFVCHFLFVLSSNVGISDVLLLLLLLLRV